VTPTTELAVDRLPRAGPSLELVALADARFGADSDCGPRRPHRHDYHELIWTRAGTGHHLIDGEVSVVEPSTVTLIGRGRCTCSSAPAACTGRSCGSATSC
jgi:hypothetical protein